VKLPNTKTVRETAVILETSERNVLALIRDQKIDAMNVGNGSVRPRWLIPDEAIQKFRPNNRVEINGVEARPKPKKRHV
jgi:hypothetical protein